MSKAKWSASLEQWYTTIISSDPHTLVRLFETGGGSSIPLDVIGVTIKQSTMHVVIILNDPQAIIHLCLGLQKVIAGVDP